MKCYSGLLIIILSCFYAASAFSQIELSGKVTDTLGKPIEFINITVFTRESTSPKAFGFTDGEGKYKILVTLDADSLDIQSSALNFETEKYTIPNKTQQVDFVLRQDVKLLETFTVKAKPIELHGDTLSYLVDIFKGKEDKTIADVLRKLPGIEIEDNGKILYQGLPINTFYVEGLDLTDGRYSKISENLPDEAVSVVEIFENHQPIRILEDRVYSPQAAINLKLKKKAAATGSGKVATGFSPWLWDVNLTPMLLSTRFQLLASYQTNNTGNDVSQQIDQLTSNGQMQFPYAPDEKIQLFDVGSYTQYGAIDQKRYLDNQIHLANFNMLVPLKKDLQLRADIFFVDDLRNNESEINSLYLLPDDSLRIIENYYRKHSRRYWQGTFHLKRNTKRNFLNNQTEFRFNEADYQDLIINANDSILQHFNTPYKELSNRLNTILRIGTSLIEFQSLIKYQDGVQKLSVFPNQLLNQQYSITGQAENLQDATIERTYLDHYAGTNFKLKRWVLSLRLGFAYRVQNLNTKLFIEQPDSLSDTLISENKLKASQYQIYLNPSVQYQNKNLRILLSWPVNQQQLSYQDNELALSNSKIKLLHSPVYSMNYSFSSWWEFHASWRFYQRMNDPDDFYYNYMLKNYRKLIKTDALIQELNRHLGKISISYRNTITTFFNKLSYLYMIRESNLLYSNQLQDDGSFIVTAVEFPNSTLSHSIEFRSSKYISALKSSLSFNAFFLNSIGQTFVNDDLFDTRTMSYSLGPEIYLNAASWVNLSYKFYTNVVNSKINNELRNTVNINKHYFNFNAFAATHLVNLNFEYYAYNGTRYNFVDLLYRYSFSESKIDLEVRWNNVLNSKTFIDQQYSQFIVTEYVQVLRPSQILLGVRFSF